MKLKCACVIPAFNEAATIGEVVAGCRRQNLAVYVVDDGSRDATAKLARAAGASVVAHATNLGKGQAMADGIARAAADGFDAVIFLDGDGQHDPAELPAFLAEAEAGADVVVGRRRLDERMPLVRRCTNRFTSWLLSRVAGCRISDAQSGFRLVRTAVWRKIRPRSGRFAAEGEMLVKAARAGARLAEVPIRTIYGGRASRIKPGRDTLRFFAMVFRLLRSG